MSVARKPFPLFTIAEPRIRVLHFTWLAFFITFLIWFAHVSLMPFIKAELLLTDMQVKAFLILNVALTIPARILIGILVDRYGPRLSYSLLLAVCGVLCIGFAMAQTFEQLAVMRFLLGLTGAGFVIGIRLVSEWFPARELGIAEGIYGGWGNFGAAIAKIGMPVLAVSVFGGEFGWRYTVALMGLIAIIYSVIFYRNVSDTPKGATYFKPKKAGGLEVTSKRDLVFYLLTNLPIYLILYVLAWRLAPAGLNIISQDFAVLCYGVITFLLVWQSWKIWQVNRHLMTETVPLQQRYRFKQVAILNLAYLACFGSEIAVVSMLPMFFGDTFHLSATAMGLMAGSFTIMNIVARPAGGYISDRIGRRKVLVTCLAAQTAGYLLLSNVNESWGIVLAIGVTLITSVFVQAACGAVYSIVPLIQRRMTGQIAGMAGAYGNVGGVLFLTVLSFVSPKVFFCVIAGMSALAFFAANFIDEPRGHMVEVDEHGNVQMIAVE
ncbi:MAG: transporter [Moraxellaceae bacterium]|jgi:NNP family nitrate/nitrite transporter-like MFS transporter|nr:transporter [Moraxellaceae bacterium]